MTEFEFNERGVPTRARKFTLDIPRRREFAPVATGRRARGELEDMVDVLCRTYLVSLLTGLGSVEFDCTVEWLAAQCTLMDGRPTSSGAVLAVLQRWEELDYAVMARDPARFVTLTEKGMRLGLTETHRRARTDRPAHYQWDAAG